MSVAVDHGSAERADRSGALEPVGRAVPRALPHLRRRRRRDHGSRYASRHSQGETRFLGGEGSPALVREPEGNGRAGLLVRVLKESLAWVRRFATVGGLRFGARRVRADTRPDPDCRAARLREAGPGPVRSARAGADNHVSATWCLTTVNRDKVHSSRLRVDQALWIGSIQRTSSGFSTGSMSRLTTTASWSLRTSTHSSGSSGLALISWCGT